MTFDRGERGRRMEASPGARIRLRNGDREIELEGDRDMLTELLARYAPWVQGGMHPDIACPPALSSDEERELAAVPHAALPIAELPRVSSSFRVQTTLTLLEFVEMKAPQTPMGILLVLAYYQEKYRQQSCYGLDELAEWWREVRSSAPFDPELAQRAVDEGYLEWETPNALTLTFTGQTHVRDGLA